MRFFRNTQDLSAWVKSLGAKKAATVLVNLPKVGEEHLKDVVETSKRIVEASDENAAEVLFGILKAAGIAEDDIKKVEEGVDQVQVANELLSKKVIASSDYTGMIKQANIFRQPGLYNDMPMRICPKLPWSVGKKLISTYNCRHYCLDGVVLDDDPQRVYCGELMWRRHVADKFSSDQQDRKTGELYGGYINDRFYKFPDAGTPANQDVPRDGGNNMRLVPGERTRLPRPHQYSMERRLQEAREKGSTTDNVLGKTASSWAGRVVEAQMNNPQANWWIVNQGKIVAGPLKESDASLASKDEANDVLVSGNTPEEALKQYQTVMSQPLSVEAKKKGKPVNPWAVCNTTVDKDKNPEKFEKCVMDVKEEHPVKESAEETAKKVIMAAGRSMFVKVSSEVVEATSGEEDVLKAFSMAIDLHNEGVSDEDAAVKVAEVTGMPITKAVSIQAMALKKMASHVSDSYIMEADEKKPVAKKGPQVKPDDEVQEDAINTGLADA